MYTCPEVALLRPGEGALVPGVPLIDRISQRVLLHKGSEFCQSS